MNREALEGIGRLLKDMEAAAAERGAPVFLAEDETRGDPFRILVFTMLSARTKDLTTLKATRRLFAVARTPRGIAALGPKRLGKLLYGVGFYRVKSRNLISICRAIGPSKNVPSTLEGLMRLPGIGRKTANIVLARAFGKPALGVDVHVQRISNRLGLVRTSKPLQTERELARMLPPRRLPELNRAFVAFGQTVCLPRKPMCAECPLNQICLRVGVKEPCPGCRHGKKAI